MNPFEPNICEWSAAPLFIFSDNVFGNFIYYSHIFPSITALVIAFFVFWHNPKGKVNQSLFFISLMFLAWCLIDLVLWAHDRPDIIMFFWSILIFFELAIYVASFYFLYSFINNRWPSWKLELPLLLTFVPLILLAHTNVNLVAFDFTNCWREALEGPLWQQYVYRMEFAIAIVLALYGIRSYRRTKEKTRRAEIAYVTIGLLIFLFSFSAGNYLGSFETDWELGQYGLFGMPIFVAFITFIIVRYKTFNIKLIATEALVAGLAILVLSILFVRRIENVQIIALATLILTSILGLLLIRSVRNEVEQRQHIEKLAQDLRKANDRLKVLDKMKSEFVSIASHQLRSPLTSIRGYTSMILEGSYGPVPPKAREALERIADSSKYMVDSVEDYLNVSRIESGNMKYEMTDFNFKDQVSIIVDELRSVALKRGLLLTFRSDITSIGIVNADIGKVRQSLHNLINNSIKYTERGSIMVSVTEDQKKRKIFATVSDTGIGMSEETIASLFAKFSRAKNANSVNTSGTGLGLYVAKQMIEHMGGTITAHSEGDGMGSVFTLELPLLQ